VGTFFLDLFCGGIVSCSSAETTVGANVGESEKSVGVPEHKIYEVQRAIHERQSDKESPKLHRFQLSEIDNKLARRSQIRLSFLHIIQKPDKHLKLIRIPSWMFHFHETGVLIPRVTHEFRQTCWWLIVVSKFIWICKRTNPPS
jgi:hypothetical protein